MPNTPTNKFKKYRRSQTELIKDGATRNAIDGLARRIEEVEKQSQQYAAAMGVFNVGSGSFDVNIKTDGSPVLLLVLPAYDTLSGEITWRVNTSGAAPKYIQANGIFYRNGIGFAIRQWATCVPNEIQQQLYTTLGWNAIDLTPDVGNNRYSLIVSTSTDISGAGLSGLKMVAIPLTFLRRTT